MVVLVDRRGIFDSNSAHNGRFGGEFEGKMIGATPAQFSFLSQLIIAKNPDTLISATCPS
jgi:hypothetical protein